MFQAAESALREGESKAANSKKADYTAACTNGLCSSPNPDKKAQYIDRWLQSGASGYYVNAAAVVSGDHSITPQYFIEYMGEAPNWVGCDREIPMQAGCMGPRYRVTAQAAVDGRAQVLLQSSYTSPE
jgi:type IV pilus assembly protein PilX